MSDSNPAAEGIDQFLANPPPLALNAVKELHGDYIILGVGGKMGTTLALMLRRALDQTGRSHAKVMGVSRFSHVETRATLESQGVQTISCDLAEPDQVALLPRAENVLYLAGQKFGTADSPDATWVQNTVVPALVARHFRSSRIVVFSTGCVYPFADTAGNGCNEQTPVAFIGDYASSCVGRERIFSHYARTFGTRVLLFRLNYAVELRYGVLVDIAMKVNREEPIDVSTGWLNCIYQSDACARAIACLELTSNPPRILNITGAEKLSVRQLAEEFGRRLQRTPIIRGQEEPTAWLADASESMTLFGPPSLSVETLITMVAAYVRGHGPTLEKPTHFETRSGQF
ncbi:epimerase [Nibricoccus aquaticus]|uniref:Epimerase n=1 Tax=Nibricoccus aquaticus TaxID=2576891 RepID=A0A290Q7K0_9BACT|nr:NAD-dependent epimerase/dehydratase family protein [Nibricoccus aquaticus]ATC64629.1 epimerase [Nibricoccus aquaticus]